MSDNVQSDVTSPADLIIGETRLRELLERCQSTEMKSRALVILRKYLEYGVPSMLEALAAVGGLHAAVECMQEPDNVAIQLGGVELLKTFTTFSVQHNALIVELGAVPLLLKHTGSSNLVLRQTAIVVLSKLITNNVEVKIFVLSHQFENRLVELITRDVDTAVLIELADALKCLCHHEKPTMSESVVQKILAGFTKLIVDHADDDIVWFIVSGVYLLVYAGHTDPVMLNDKLMCEVVQLLKMEDIHLLRVLVGVFCNITDGPHVHTSMLLGHNLLPLLQPMLLHHDEFIRRESCWTIVNVISHGEKELQLVLDANLLPNLLFNLQQGAKQAIWAMNFIIVIANAQQLFAVYKGGMLASFCNCLKCDNDQSILGVLWGLRTLIQRMPNDYKQDMLDLLKGHGIVLMLHTLCQSQNPHVHAKALLLLNTYYSDEPVPPTKSVVAKFISFD